MRPQRLISITGIVSADGQVQVLTVARVEAAPRTDGRETELTARLLGGDGAVLAQAPLVRLNAQGSECGTSCGEDDSSSYPFQAILPDVEHGEALTILAGRDEIWTRRAPDEPPHIGRVAAEVDEDGSLTMQWELTAGESPEVWLQWSMDQGRSWRGLATGLTGDSVRLAPGGLPPGDLQVRVLAHDGFSTAISEPVNVQVPDQAPAIAILHPADGQTLIAGTTMRLWSAISAPGGGPVEANCSWELDGNLVADSDDAWIEAPTPGSHQLTLIVRTSGGEAESTVSFTTEARPNEHAQN